MIKHCIILASAYSLGKRIALDFFDEEVLQMDIIKKDIDFIFQQLGEDAPISTHYIQTEKIGWDEVEKKDEFFKGAQLIDSKEHFVSILLSEQNLKGIDIAKYILTKLPCTHLKLEKLVYMCYADYLCSAGKKLFEDKIYAYRLGPVIKSVYDRYKKRGLGFIEEDDTKTEDETGKKMPIRSRILASKDGIAKMLSIDSTIRKYGLLSANELVRLTHRSSTPWCFAGAGTCLYEEIDDELIIKFHKNETI